MALSHGAAAHLLGNNYKTEIARWLEEDCPGFDWGGFVVGEAPAEANLLCKSPGVLAGVPFFDEVFRQLDCSVEWHVAEGTVITAPAPAAPVATVRGPARKLLLGERVALNTLARCSGIATQTAGLVRQVHQAAAAAGAPPPIVAGTRKTTPGFRRAEKYALLVGGADPHRHDLSAMAMIKDNHGWLAVMNRGAAADARAGLTDGAAGRGAGQGDWEALAAAVAAAKAAGGFAVKVEVECASQAAAAVAVRAGADVVMLDNMGPAEVATAAAELRATFRGSGRSFLVEVSGGLTAENVGAYAQAGVDILSTSSIHQGVKHVDFSLKIVH